MTVKSWRWVYMCLPQFFFFPLLATQYVESQLPDQGSNSHPLPSEAWSLNHWTAREVPPHSSFNFPMCLNVCIKKCFDGGTYV